MIFPMVILLHYLVQRTHSQHWWNFDEHINPYELPVFMPLQNQRFTHPPVVHLYGPMPNDVIVNIPKAGMGTFIGFSSRVNYDFTWTEWPPERGRLVNIFLGIPYAAPPVEDQRFRPPVPAYLDTRHPWYAKSYRSACMQNAWFYTYLFGNFTDFSEDCLYLNIFSPNRTWEDPSTRYPVVIHLHGGSFVYGSSHIYPGQALASKGVVVVTLNYRLGPFGFLSTGDFASAGNYGLWDQLLAIRWVKENIVWFRGDPDRITLMGESAGAASVGLHAVSPASRDQGLFHRLIMMSGAELSGWAVSDPNRIRVRYYAIELGRLVGCPSVQSAAVRASQEAMYGEPWLWNTTNNTNGGFGSSTVRKRLSVPSYARVDATALIRCLRYEKTAQEILKAALQMKHLRGATNFIWTPVLDGVAGFLPRAPFVERKLGHFAKLPVLAGVVHDEGLQPLLARISEWQKIPTHVSEITDEFARKTIGNIANHENVLRFNATVEELYTLYSWWPNMANNSARWERLVALVSDYEINAPLVTAIQFHAELSLPVYFYEFSYLSTMKHGQTGNLSNAAQSQLKYAGVYHGAELPYVFGHPFLNLTFRSTPFDDMGTRFSYPHDTNVSEFAMDLWTNFIKYGDPTPVPVKNLTWPRFNKSAVAYLFIYLNSSIKHKFRPLHMAFWRERFEKLAEPVAPSPPLHYFPWFTSKWITVILACVVGVTVILIICLSALLARRPDPDRFRHNVRLATPGAAPGTAFRAAFEDVNNRTHSPYPRGCPKVPMLPLPVRAYSTDDVVRLKPPSSRTTPTYQKYRPHASRRPSRVAYVDREPIRTSSHRDSFGPLGYDATDI